MHDEEHESELKEPDLDRLLAPISRSHRKQSNPSWLKQPLEEGLSES